MLNALIRYFDLQSEYRDVIPTGHAGGGPSEPVLPQYLALVAGVVVEPYLRNYTSTGYFAFDGIANRILFGAIVGAIILPAVYKSAFDPQKPIIIQLLALLPLGIGWQSIFNSITKTTFN